METISVVVGVVGGLTGIASMIVTEKRNRQADKRRDEDKLRQLWTGMILAVQEILIANVLTQNMTPLMNQFRTAATELVDGVPEGKYKHLALWVELEGRVMHLLRQRALLQLSFPEPSAEHIIQAHAPAIEWGREFLDNLRRARKNPSGPETDAGIQKLIEHAEAALEQLSGGVQA